MFNTVLEQGDQVGSTGPIGITGAVGITGAGGQPRNILAIEGIYTFQAASPYYTFTKTYVVEQGDAGFWVASASHVYAHDATDGRTTLTNFLQDNTKKFSPLIERVEMTLSGDVEPIASQGIPYIIQFDQTAVTSGGTLRWRIVNNTNSSTVTWFNLGNLYPGGKLNFTILIIGTDS